MQKERLPYSVFRRLILAEFVEAVVVLPIRCVKEDRRYATKVTKITEKEITSSSLYVFFWVFHRRLNVICRRFGTLSPIFIGR
jgi:hypothetical protein